MNFFQKNYTCLFPWGLLKGKQIQFIINILETDRLLAMFHKRTVNWTNIWDFWSTFKTKTFNGTLCLCHLRGHQSFPPVVIYFRFVQHIILPIWRSCKVPLWNSQMEETIYRKFLQNQKSIKITGKCRLRVFSRRNMYDKRLNIWKYKFSRISHCGFVTLMY